MSASNQAALKPRNSLHEEEFDWRSLVVAGRERLWLIILLHALGVAVGWAYMKRTPSVYESRATLEVEDRQRAVKFDAATDNDVRDAATMNTVAATIQSRTLLSNVAEREKFTEQRDFFGQWTGAKAPGLDDVVNVLADSLNSAVRPGTRLIDIKARHPNPEIARNIAQAAAEGIIRFGQEQKTLAAVLVNSRLEPEAKRLKTILENSELALQEYREKNNAVSLEKDQNLVVARLNDLNAKWSAASATRVQLETDYNALKALSGKPEATLALPSVSGNVLIANLTRAIADKKSDIAVIKNRYKSKHPKYIALQTELSSLEDQLKKAIPDVLVQLESALEGARTNESEYKVELAAQEQKAIALDRLAVQYNVRKRDVDTNKKMYDSVDGSIKELGVTKEMENNNLKIHEVATTPVVPVWPSATKVYGASIGGGLLIALTLVLLAHFLDRSVKTVSQAEKTFHLPVLGAVCAGKKLASSALEAWKEPHGSVAESFRSLRAMASLLGREDERRTFLITSALPSEGKTFCASNYAVSLAQQGLRTLLIDADLRKPRISAVFFNEARKPGLTEYLVGKIELAGSIHETEMENLKIMPAGERSPNPAELLAGSGMKRLLAEALMRFDRIVIDSAPVVAVSDTLLIAPLVETAFLVIQWNKTASPVVSRALGMLGDAGKTPSGLILNQLPVNSKSYYYYYSPGYYGSKGVYGAPA